MDSKLNEEMGITYMIEWRNLYRGFLMGISDIIPGVSGGTIAVVLGIYRGLIEGINGILTKEWKKHAAFLVPLGVGVLAALYFFSGIINWLFEHYPNQLQFTFLGLIAGVIPFLWRKAEASKEFGGSHYLILILAAIFVGSMVVFQSDSSIEPMTEFAGTDYILLFLSGWLASSAMILPGISGSFLLLLVGMYTTFTYSIENLVFEALIPLGLGIVLGLLIMSRIIRALFNRFYFQTYAMIIGLVIGALVVIYPGFESDMMRNVLSIICLIAGLIAAYGLGKLELTED